ncbi:hypothetical protein [Agrobacterium deltaense]|uniref:hypothetical protein n=1 Tax=Agrobacterium deltaense TaxID=1183412 RepID=UPI000F62C426|nr:hypothetical protein [Agrobacterium deltaense]RRN68590.1 hypothetical protein EIQ31_20505 [Agrobacterium deltaense]
MLTKLYVQHVNDSDTEAFSVDEIKSIFSVPVSRNLISSALDELYGPKYSDKALVHRSGTKRSERRYRITSAGIQFVEKSLRDSASDIAYFLAQGDTSLDEIAGMDGLFWTDEERTEKSGWTEIELEEGKELEEVIEGLNLTIDEIEKNDEFEAKDPEQKRGILASLRIGLASLKSLKVSKNQINGIIIQPLRWIATNFTNTVMAELAKTAAQKVVKLVLTYLG